ncbi:hypothetical protein ACI0FR_01965 [Paenochrobactrum sp. BZR 201-1]
MTADIIDFTGTTTLDIDPDRILQSAVGQMEQVVIIGWDKDGQTFTTHEVINGKRVKVQDSFRQFSSPSDSVSGYADFLSSNKRYQPMLQAQGLDAQVAALGRSNQS